MKKFLLMALLVVMVVSMAMPAFAAEKITVTFWHAMSSGHGGFLQKLIDDFNASQDEIEVVGIYQGSYGDLSKKLLGAVASGEPPVVAQMYEDWTTKFVENDKIEAVQWYIGSVFTQEEIDDIIWSFQLSNSWDDTMYTMPFNKSTNLLYVNLDLVDKVPTTWDELVEQSKVATKDVDGDGVIDIYGFGIRPTVDTFNIFLRQAGGDFLDENGKAIFNSQAGVDALQFLHDMVYKHKVAMIYQGYLNEPLGEGKLAMYQDSSAGMPYAAQAVGGKFAWTAAPLVAGVQAAAPFMGTNLAVFTDHSDEVKSAAMEFLKFMVNTENTAWWAIQSGYLPIRYSALETPEWEEFVAADSKNAAGPAQFDYGTFDPKPDGWSTIRDIIGDYVQQALLNEMSIQDALDAAAAEANKILGF